VAPNLRLATLLGTAAHAIHESFCAQAVAREDLLVAPEIDRVGELAQDLSDELVRISGAVQHPLELRMRPARRRRRHTASIRSTGLALLAIVRGPKRDPPRAVNQLPALIHR
jgi:hypothetical protein